MTRKKILQVLQESHEKGFFHWYLTDEGEIRALKAGRTYCPLTALPFYLFNRYIHVEDLASAFRSAQKAKVAMSLAVDFVAAADSACPIGRKRPKPTQKLRDQILCAVGLKTKGVSV